MNELDLERTIWLVVKIGGIFFAVLHLLIAVLLYMKVNRMRRVITTGASGIITLFSLIHIVLLFVIIILIILIPV